MYAGIGNCPRSRVWAAIDDLCVDGSLEGAPSRSVAEPVFATQVQVAVSHDDRTRGTGVLERKADSQPVHTGRDTVNDPSSSAQRHERRQRLRNRLAKPKSLRFEGHDEAEASSQEKLAATPPNGSQSPDRRRGGTIKLSHSHFNQAPDLVESRRQASVLQVVDDDAAFHWNAIYLGSSIPSFGEDSWLLCSKGDGAATASDADAQLCHDLRVTAMAMAAKPDLASYAYAAAKANAAEGVAARRGVRIARMAGAAVEVAAEAALAKLDELNSLGFNLKANEHKDISLATLGASAESGAGEERERPLSKYRAETDHGNRLGAFLEVEAAADREQPLPGHRSETDQKRSEHHRRREQRRINLRQHRVLSKSPTPEPSFRNDEDEHTQSQLAFNESSPHRRSCGTRTFLSAPESPASTRRRGAVKVSNRFFVPVSSAPTSTALRSHLFDASAQEAILIAVARVKELPYSLESHAESAAMTSQWFISEASKLRGAHAHSSTVGGRSIGVRSGNLDESFWLGVAGKAEAEADALIQANERTLDVLAVNREELEETAARLTKASYETSAAALYLSRTETTSENASNSSLIGLLERAAGVTHQLGQLMAKVACFQRSAEDQLALLAMMRDPVTSFVATGPIDSVFQGSPQVQAAKANLSFSVAAKAVFGRSAPPSEAQEVWGAPLVWKALFAS